MKNSRLRDTEAADAVTTDKKEKTKAGRRRTRGTSPKKAWTFPKNTLEEAITIPKAIEEKNGGNPMHAGDLAKAVGFRQANDWRFLDLLRSANLYGLVSGPGAAATVSLEQPGQDIVAPGSQEQRQKALLAAFRTVPDFKRVDDFYGGKRIPEDEFFLNTLTRDFQIPRDRVERFAEVFRANQKFLTAFAVPRELPGAGEKASGMTVSDEEHEEIDERGDKQPRTRKFLDTCFMMMPFGDWFNRYYQDIYVPAIRDAGFEPVRADEL